MVVLDVGVGVRPLRHAPVEEGRQFEEVGGAELEGAGERLLVERIAAVMLLDFLGPGVEDGGVVAEGDDAAVVVGLIGSDEVFFAVLLLDGFGFSAEGEFGIEGEGVEEGVERFLDLAVEVEPQGKGKWREAQGEGLLEPNPPALPEGGAVVGLPKGFFFRRDGLFGEGDLRGKEKAKAPLAAKGEALGGHAEIDKGDWIGVMGAVLFPPPGEEPFLVCVAADEDPFHEGDSIIEKINPLDL